MITYSTRRLKKHLLRLYNKAITFHEETPTTSRNTTIKVTCKSGDPSSPWNHWPLVRSRSCTNSLASSSSSVYKPLLTPASLLIKQASDQATPRPLTHSPVTQTDSRPVAPLLVTAIDLEKNIRHSGAQKCMEGLTGARRRGTMHTHELYDQQRSNSGHPRQKQISSRAEPNRETHSARSCWLTPAIHHEATKQKSVPGNQTWRARHQHEPLQSQVRRRHPSHHHQKRSLSRARTPHQMRVGNIHERQAGVDVTSIPTEEQTQALRRHGDTITSWTVTEEMKKKLQRRQRRMMRVIMQTERKTGKCPAAARAANVDERARVRYDWNPSPPPPSSLPPKTPTSKKKAATTQRATPLATKFQTTSQKTNWNHGSTT